MCKSEHELVIALLQRYFNLPNGNVVSNPPIIVAGQPDHPSPNADGLVIAPDIAAKLWRQGAPTQKWHFGTVQKGNNNPTGCNAPSIPAYQINIPISDVFYDPPIPTIGYTPSGAPPPPAIINGSFTIDLYEIQQEVLNSQVT
ncbi:hypothetical protein F8M41_023418 [Gigaspora margarita]|uniref:Uncharacterized protein n=1 Tax=Gigaspora margarita TaxID=4874 RepID=A0A8H4B0T9_GIGMA|nr:hypothetical protein F8M41_023418 [Gigaspora margarita]